MSGGLGIFAFKHARVCVGDHPMADPTPKIQRSDLVGRSNESNIKINDLNVRALLDTGANVSTISHGKYCELFNNVPLHSLQTFKLDIEGAGGHMLPYLGYIEVKLAVPVLRIEPVSCLLLVTPNTNYSLDVPVILGTNILERVLQRLEYQCGTRFQQTSQLPDAWYFTFRCMKVQVREVHRSSGRIAVIKSAIASKLLIPSNTTIMVDGRLDKQLKSGSSFGLTQTWSESSLPSGISITPALVDVQSHGPISVELSNLSSNPIVVSPGSVICQVQACELVSELPVGEHVDIPDEPWLNKIDLSKAVLTEHQKVEVKNLVADWHQVFSKHDLDVGITNLVKHRINVTDSYPFKQRHRKIPHSMYKEVRDHLQQLLDIGIIRKSDSPWASNIVLVRKKDQSLRLCVDFRQLNNRTVKDAYALPRVEELLEGLGGNQYYSVLDMKMGYHQVEIEENHKQYTAFTAGPLGFFEYTRLPFGLSNAPATYQRLMENCLSDLMFGEDKVCHIYLDDVIIASKSYADHMVCLEKVFTKLADAGLKLSPKKCFLFQDKVKYVGHVVSSQGIETDPEKITKISNWPTPKNVDEVRTFLGFTSYYRRFVKSFASIAKPLNQLLTGSKKKKHFRKSVTRTQESGKWEWGERQQSAFDSLKQVLTSPPILAYPEYTKPFILHTDASINGLGAVLYQNFNGIDRVIAYASRGLSVAEQRYPAHKLEFLALKWAITSKFHDYLYGNKFVVFTDNNPMTYVLEKAKLDATGHRWIAALGVYDFTIKYRTGKSHQDADGLSRMPQTDDIHEVSTDSIKALCQSHSVSPCITSLSLTSEPINGLDIYDEVIPRDWRQIQSQDPLVNMFVRAVTVSKKPFVSQVKTRVGKTLLREFNKLVIKRGVLYRRIQTKEGHVFQLVIPEHFKTLALKGAHDDMGHLHGFSLMKTAQNGV
jgi:dUTPase